VWATESDKILEMRERAMERNTMAPNSSMASVSMGDWGGDDDDDDDGRSEGVAPMGSGMIMSYSDNDDIQQY